MHHYMRIIRSGPNFIQEEKPFLIATKVEKLKNDAPESI